MASQKGHCEEVGSEMKEAASRGHSLPTRPRFCHLPRQEEAARSPRNGSCWLRRCWEAVPSTAGVSLPSHSAGLTLPQRRKTVNPTSPPARLSQHPTSAGTILRCASTDSLAGPARTCGLARRYLSFGPCSPVSRFLRMAGAILRLCWWKRVGRSARTWAKRRFPSPAGSTPTNYEAHSRSLHSKPRSGKKR